VRVQVVASARLPYAGGASTHIGYLVDGLRNRGVDVRLQSLNGSMRPVRWFTTRVANRLGAGSWRLLMVRSNLAYFARTMEQFRESYDLVHAHDPFAATVSVGAVGGSRPVVLTMHGPLTYEMISNGVPKSSRLAGYCREVEQTAYLGCDRIIAVDSGQARILTEDFGVPACKVHVIRNAVDVAEVVALSSRSPAHVFQVPYLVVPRRLVHKNGVEHAIRALRYCRDETVQLVVAGDGPLSKNLREAAEILRVCNRVHFLGSIPREQLIPLMAQAMGVVVPSVPSAGVVEATSLSVLEAMACRVPVIGSNIGGIAEILSAGPCGILVPPGDERAIAKAMDVVHSGSFGPQEDMVRRAYELVTAEYDVAPWVDKVIAVYTSAIREKQCA